MQTKCWLASLDVPGGLGTLTMVRPVVISHVLGAPAFPQAGRFSPHDGPPAFALPGSQALRETFGGATMSFPGGSGTTLYKVGPTYLRVRRIGFSHWGRGLMLVASAFALPRP